MGNIIEKLSKILKDKKEIVTNLILVVLTVVTTFNAVQLYRANKSDKQGKVEKKQVQQYNGQELLQPTVENNVVEEEQNTEQQPETNIAEQQLETNISEQTIQEEIKEVEIVKTSVGYSSIVTPETMKIMGYEEIDADKAITFIVSLVGEDNVDKIKLNGTSLNFHISNTNKAAKAEDVNAYFVLAQQLLETGNLKFENSSVKPEYYNFAGLGATDSKPNPNKFFSNYEGQLAQVQHLKGYATKDPLKEECKDQRFALLMDKRGTATNAAELSNKWASNSSYGELLAEMYNQFHNTEVNSEIVSKYKYRTL